MAKAKIEVKKCGKSGCYADDFKSTCAKCRKPIEPNEPRHSFMDMMNPSIKNYHCRCVPR